MFNSLYDILGVQSDATIAEIKKIFKDKAKKLHPDVGGNPKDFATLKRAYDVLSNEERRRRYDNFGRTTESLVSSDRVDEYIRNMMQSVVEARDAFGRTDDPVHEDIRFKMVESASGNLREIRLRLDQTMKKLKRANELRQRFKKTDHPEHDPVGSAIKAQIRRLEQELEQQQDVEELVRAVLDSLAEYSYEVDAGGTSPTSTSPSPYSNVPPGWSYVGR